jgi:hypothetical protein
LDWRFILQDQAQLGLRCKDAQHFDAWLLQKFAAKIQTSCSPQTTILPLFPLPKTVWGKSTQAPIPVDISPKLSPNKIKEIKHIIGSILNYARAADITVLMALSSIMVDQTKGTPNTMEKAKQLLDYLAKNPDATIQFHALDMIMNVHSDAS